MADTDPNQSPEIDAPRAEAPLDDRFLKTSRAIVSAGMLLGFVATAILGREFKANDPIIGPLLGPLSFVWLVAFFHLFYSVVRPYLSRFVQILCYVFFAILVLVLGKILAVDPLL
ncbi:MAG: hypothetical protein ACIALR_03470 [Blastopirellula sp. JB062]